MTLDWNPNSLWVSVSLSRSLEVYEWSAECGVLSPLGSGWVASVFRATVTTLTNLRSAVVL